MGTQDLGTRASVPVLGHGNRARTARAGDGNEEEEGALTSLKPRLKVGPSRCQVTALHLVGAQDSGGAFAAGPGSLAPSYVNPSNPSRRALAVLAGHLQGGSSAPGCF